MTFEIICKQDKAIAYRENPQMSLDNVLLSDEIYLDAKQGKTASAADVQKYLPAEPVKHILLNGHVTLSTEERRKRVEQRMQDIIGYIHSNYLDNSGKPIPPERVKAAIDQLKGVQLDPFVELVNEVEEILKKLEKASLLYVQSGGMEVTITVKYEQLSKVQQILKKLQVKILNEEYGTEIKLQVQVSVGNMDEMVAQLEKECKGAFNLKVAGAEDKQQVQQQQVEEGAEKKGKKDKKKGK